MSVAKAVDIESVRFSAPNLGEMRRFMIDFGMFDAGGLDDGVLRLRGTGPLPVLHETIEGEPGFAGLSMRVRGMEDLKALAEAEGAKVTAYEGPGGGHIVNLRDPDGFAIEAIADRARVQEKTHGSRAPWNVIARRERHGAAKRVEPGPASVVRLGHVVMNVSNMQASWDWWQSRFGLLISDEVRAPNGDVAALFIRCDRGDEAVDHHTLNFAAIPGLPPKFHHAAFEVADLDDLMAGSKFLEEKGYRHDWGIARHILGSQVFDYWRDPFGNRVEHWTDGDLFDASVPTNVNDISVMMGRQWGPASPEDFAS